MTLQIIPGQDNARAIDKAVPRAALATSGGALACAACCVLPIAFPAIALAFGGALLAWIDVATKAMIIAALVSVLCACGWIAYRALASARRTPRATPIMMGAATAVLVAGLAFPVYEPLIIAAIRG